MSAVPARLRHESGQAIVFVIAIMTVLIGIGALVIDGGSWFRTQRHLQTAADAAALAGAQDLPNTECRPGQRDRLCAAGITRVCPHRR